MQSTEVLEAVEAGRFESVMTRGDKKSFRRLARLLHPDVALNNGIDPQRAHSAFEAASSWFNGQTRTSSKVILTTRTNSYVLGEKVADGTVSVVYQAKAGDSASVVAKMARKPAHNDFLDAERDTLKALAEVGQQHDWLSSFYPPLVDALRHRDAETHAVRRVNILGERPGRWFTLAQVAAAYPSGLDGRDWAWMHRRLLAAIGGAGLANRVHGAIVPENILIEPTQHWLKLVGWSFAVEPGQVLPGRVASRSDLYPPEALAGEPVTEATDIFMAHKVMSTMLARSERAQLAFAAGCTQTSPGLRPDVAGLVVEYDELVVRLYGPKKFRPFVMPDLGTTS